jgi:putative membrane protein insertion efficiency factor
MKTAFRWLIQCYRLLISPMLGPRCRFFPSCSVYALEALEQHALGYALWLIVKRLGRCQPWGGSGYDPVPTSNKQRSKNDSQRKKIIHLMLSKSVSCSCCTADRKSSLFLWVRSDQNDLQNSHQNGHQNHNFTPYTNPPPYHHRVYF